jgi:hypothetical protein
MNVAAGGTSGWFQDNQGDKPWIDGDPFAIRSFVENQATWSATWPDNEDDRAMRMCVSPSLKSPFYSLC